jgi:cyclic-di-GMP phosphodiesterase, flagellum assembly factor TipF
MRFSAAFIAACMVIIAAGLAAVAYLMLGFTWIEAAATALTILASLATYNALTGRVHDRSDVGHQIADLSHGTANLARQVQELGRRLTAVETTAAQAGAEARVATAPLAAEIEVLAGLVNALAESVAAHEVALVGAAQAASAPAPPSPTGIEPTADATTITRTIAAGAPRGSSPESGEGAFAGRPREEAVAAIRDALEANRLDLHLQPIVTLPQRKVRHYEAFARLRASGGELLTPADYLGYAESGGLLPTLDCLMLFRCVQVLRRLSAKKREVGLFCNVAGATLADSEAFAQISEFLAANRAFASSLVLEFAQGALRELGLIEQESLAQLASLGFRFSLDRVGDLNLEPKQLAEQGFRFVKIPAPLLLARTGSTASDIHPADLSSLLGRYGIDLIAEKVESEGTAVDLLDYNVGFGQGFLFSPPRPVRAEVFQGGAERIPQMQAPSPPLPVDAKPIPVETARPAPRRQVQAEAASSGEPRLPSALAQLAREMVRRA